MIRLGSTELNNSKLATFYDDIILRDDLIGNILEIEGRKFLLF